MEKALEIATPSLYGGKGDDMCPPGIPCHQAILYIASGNCQPSEEESGVLADSRDPTYPGKKSSPWGPYQVLALLQDETVPHCPLGPGVVFTVRHPPYGRQ